MSGEEDGIRADPRSDGGSDGSIKDRVTPDVSKYLKYGVAFGLGALVTAGLFMTGTIEPSAIVVENETIKDFSMIWLMS